VQLNQIAVSNCLLENQNNKKVWVSQKQSFALPWINFINILHKAFTRPNPKSVKIQLSCQYLFTLLGSEDIKAAHKK